MKKENKNFFSGMKAEPDDWAEWGGEEGKSAYLKSLGNFPHRHPVNKEHWNNMSDVSILGAALYTMGIDPDAIDDFNNYGHENADFDGLILSERDERLAIIKSAVRAGVIELSPVQNKNMGTPDDYTFIKKDSFIKWHKFHGDKLTNKSIAKAMYPALKVDAISANEIADYIDQPLAESERISLYKMILGMAIAKYDYLPEGDTRSNATGEGRGSIKQDLENAGIKLSNDTILKHLKLAAANDVIKEMLDKNKKT